MILQQQLVLLDLLHLLPVLRPEGGTGETLFAEVSVGGRDLHHLSWPSGYHMVGDDWDLDLPSGLQKKYSCPAPQTNFLQPSFIQNIGSLIMG